MLIALHELPGNHLVIPPVTQMNLSALSAMWDMRRQQVRTAKNTYTWTTPSLLKCGNTGENPQALSESAGGRIPLHY